jgi:transcriptional regulator with XRE-family HTH domain
MQLGTSSPGAQTLAALLRATRKGAGISQRELSRRLRVANTTVGRWEKAEAVPSVETVGAVLDCLGIDGSERKRILSIANGSVSGNWLASGPAVSKQLADVMEYEHTATHATHWEPLVIPGVLQTRDYARAMMSAHGTVSEGAADARVTLRLARRDAITRRRDPTRLVALIGEQAIRGGIGGPTIMADQLRQIVDLAERDNITIQVVSMSGQWHPGHAGPFILYEFDETLQPFVFLEHHRSGALVVAESDIQDYRTAIEIIRGEGMSPEDSIELITDLIKTLEATP